MNGMPWCTEPFNFDGIHHDRIAVPDTLRVQDTISFLVISELGVIGMLRLQTGQHPVGSSQPSFHHPRRDDIQPLPPRYRAYPNTIQRYLLLSAPQNKVLGQYRIIKCRYGERGAADAKPKAQIILDVLSSILATQMPCRSRRSGA